jgi:hypothetical protein
MRRRISTMITTGAAASALTVALCAAPSSAATTATWTVKPGGNVSASGSLHLKDTKTGTISGCSSIKLIAVLKSGSGLAGQGIGSITSGTFTGCMVLETLNIDVTANGLPWTVDATSYKSGVTSGAITGIDFVGAGPGCSATLDGTAAGKNNGTIKFTYTNSTGKLKLLPKGGNLHWWAVSGCLGVISDADPVQPSGTLTVSPEQAITSP